MIQILSMMISQKILLELHQKFILKKNNANTVGIGTSGGNGIVLINEFIKHQ